MNITEDVVRNVANLARLAVSEKEAGELAPQLSEIISYAQLLQKVDLTDVEPTSHSFALTNVLREDVPREGLSAKLALKNAPDRDGQQVRVPAAFEG